MAAEPPGPAGSKPAASPYAAEYLAQLHQPGPALPAVGPLSGHYARETFAPLPLSPPPSPVPSQRAQPAPLPPSGPAAALDIRPVRRAAPGGTRRAPQALQTVTAATWLAALLGPFGLAYISARAALLGLLAFFLAAATSQGWLVLLTWLGCVAAARAGARGKRLEDIARLRARDVL